MSFNIFSKKVFIASVILLTGLCAASLVLAVGGGGGGAVPTCSADTWSCGDWTTCSASGTQSRTCTMTYDCPGVDTPMPAQNQMCTPPPTPPAPTPTPAGAAPSPAAPQCSADKWTCGNWSASCDINGQEHRTCKVSFDCPNVDTPEPAIDRACTKLQCGDKTDLRDRIYCRLNLAPAGIARELQIKYLPEECRAIPDATEQKDCIAKYKSYQPCWNIPDGDTRFACAQNVLKLGPVISDEVKTCQGMTGAAQKTCKADLRDKVFYMIKFRLYDLEQRAEQLALRGADMNAVADLETTIETKKQAFDAATTDDARKQLILDVRQVWSDFINKVKDQVK